MSSAPDETTQFDIRQKVEGQVQGSSGHRVGSHDPTVGHHHDATSQNGPVKTSSNPPARVGRYELRKEIGSGTFGEVFLCYDPQLKREVAIKLRRYQPSGSSGPTSDMLHEAQSVARLRHPGIVAVLDMGTTDDGRGFIVYEYVEGQNLRERIEAGNITRRDAVRWVAETAEALHYAHTRGLVHRDVKPANILVDQAGHTRLADFGLAKIDDSFFTDDTGRVLGTVAYMSPEQASGHSHWATSQSDIYSLGVVLYELLCGRRPFNSDSSMDLLEQVKFRPPAPPRSVDDDIPKALEAICLKAMAKEPADRFTTAADMAAELRAMLAEPRTGSRSWIVAAAASLILAGAVAWALYSRSNDSAEIASATASNSITTSIVSESAASGVKPPELEILLQRRLQVDDFVKLHPENLPIYTGDKVQIHAKLDQPAYVYLYWYDAKGKATRLWPDASTSLDDQHPTRDVWSPLEAKNGPNAKWWPVDGAPGAELALVAVADKPLTSAEVEQFERKTFLLSQELSRTRQMVEFVHPEPLKGTVPRGLGQTPVVSPKKVTGELEPELNSRFNAYRGWLFFQAEAKP